jgi:hypothetical protein
MSCILSGGYTLGCKDQTGGIKEVYIKVYDSTDIFAEDGTEGVIEVATDSSDAALAYFKFEQRNEQGEFTQTGNHSVENGTNFWTQAVNLVFSKNDVANRNTLKVLAQARLSVIVLDQNGVYWLVGETNGVDLVASTSGAGKAYGDLSGSTITLEAMEKLPASQLSETTFNTLSINPS